MVFLPLVGEKGDHLQGAVVCGALPVEMHSRDNPVNRLVHAAGVPAMVVKHAVILLGQLPSGDARDALLALGDNLVLGLLLRCRPLVGNSYALSGSLKELVKLVNQDAPLVRRNVIDILDNDLLLQLLLPAVHGREDGVKEGVDQLADEDDVSGILQVVEV